MKNAGTDRETVKKLMVKFNKAVASRNDDDLLAVYKEFSPDDYKTLHRDFCDRRLSIEAYEQFLVANKKNAELQQVCESIADLHKQVFVDVLILPNKVFCDEL